MKNIPRYISELLFEYECVVLPGLGGFITNEHPATIQRLTHEFKPPYHRLFFNVHLKTDDGLLVNTISQKEGISYAEARKMLEEFTARIQLDLRHGEVVQLENIGSLSFDDGKNISFDQDYSVNFNTMSYGLKTFISPSIKRVAEGNKIPGLVVTERTAHRKPIDRKKKEAGYRKEQRKKAFVKPSMIIAMMALLVITISWGLQNRDNVINYWQSQASLFPFDNTTPQYQPRQEKVSALVINEAVLEDDQSGDAEVEINNKLTPEPEVVSSETESVEEMIEIPKEIVPAKVEFIETPDENIALPKPSPSTKMYYVIAGSFGKEKNAVKLVEQLRQKGFEAMIADTNANGMFRVAYTRAENIGLAKKKLQVIREEDNADAWILKK